MSNSNLALILRHSALKGLYRQWMELCGQGDFPLASDLDPATLRPWLDHLVLIRVENGDFVYGYYSPSYAEIFDGDRIGQSIDRLPEPQRALLRREYEQVREERLPVSRTYTAAFGDEEQTWERLVLPFFAPDGEVEKLLVAAYRLEE